MVRTTRKKHEVEGDFLKEEYMTATATTGSPVAGTFHSTVVGRSKMIDLSQDLGVRFGSNRIATQQSFKIQDEQGPNGEDVFGVVNDKYNQIRLVGGWIDTNNVNGQQVVGNIVEAYAEITFYGTGLNYLIFHNGGASTHLASVDGGAEGSNLYPTPTAVTNARNYSQNVRVNVASNLTLGIHTVKIRLSVLTTGLHFAGIEILNERTDLLVPKGGYYKNGNLIRNLTEQNIPYATGFTNTYGTLGTKGGCVAVYLDENGTLKKDIQWTDVTSNTLGSTDHSNEEIIAKHNFREFGAGRADDFSTMATASVDRAYTLDDGTTTLVADGMTTITSGTTTTMFPDTSFFILTFVGTGLDLIAEHVNVNSYNVQIDGAAAVSLTSDNDQTVKITKIVSGLPYGTHTVKVTRVSGLALYVSDFIIYGPKKPTIEATSQEIGSYFLMADFVANATEDINTISAGILRKHCAREITYTGTATISFNTIVHMGGYQVFTNTTSDTISYTFFGTGFDLRYYAHSTYTADARVTLNGTSLIAGNFATASFSTYGVGTSYDSVTNGSLDQAGSGTPGGQGFVCSGLPLGKYTVELTANTAASMSVNSFDIITPIHSPKLNGPNIVQNTLRVGSTAIGDSRVLKDEDTKSITKAIGVTVGAFTNLAAYQPMVDSSLTVKSKGANYTIKFSTSGKIGAVSESCAINFLINGKPMIPAASFHGMVTSHNHQIHYERDVYLPKGTHSIIAIFSSSGGAGTTLEQRSFSAIEV